MEIKLDLCAAKGGACQTQPKWNTDYNSGEIPGVFAAVPDYFADRRHAVIPGVRTDFFESHVCAATTFLFNKTNLRGSIVHNYGSKKIIPVWFDLLIPNFSSGIFLDELVELDEGVRLTRALLNQCYEGKQELKNRVELLSGMPASKTYIFTPNQESRKQEPTRVAFLYYGSDDFRINGTLNLIDAGRSRGVQY